MKRIVIFIVICVLSSCAATHKKNTKAHNKIWDSYKTCSAYGNP